MKECSLGASKARTLSRLIRLNIFGTNSLETNHLQGSFPCSQQMELQVPPDQVTTGITQKFLNVPRKATVTLWTAECNKLSFTVYQVKSQINKSNQLQDT